MNITCPYCHGTNKIDEAEYQPGTTAVINCWRCGEEIEVSLPASPVPASKSNMETNVVKKSSSEHHVASGQVDTELEKARLVLEAERIKLEHRKLEHDLEVKKLQQTQENFQMQQNLQISDEFDMTPDKPRKDKTTAGLLAIFLGGLGAHKFYLGKTGMGVLYLMFCWTYIPGIIGLIEGITYFTKKEEDFHRNCY